PARAAASPPARPRRRAGRIPGPRPRAGRSRCTASSPPDGAATIGAAMTVVEIVFWICAGLLVYSLVGYPLLLVALARLRPRRPEWGRSADRSPSVSVIVPAYAEAGVISDR